MASRRAPSLDELDFQDHLKLVLGRHNGLRIWRQNTGSVPVRDPRGRLLRYFHAGPPTGAADLSGIVVPHGYRLEIELKSPNGTRSLEQIRWADFIARSGGVYALVTYDASLSLDDNLARAVAIVESAIVDRCSR